MPAAVRNRCYSCFRPEPQCLCDLIDPIDHRTRLVILQHPKERGHAFNTVRIAARCLPGTRVETRHIDDLAADPDLANGLEGHGLLYPGPGARDVSTLPPGERPRGLVVLDGTWPQARAMYRHVAALRDLPHFTLPPGNLSGFRIRQQPAEHCLSTLEAIHLALTWLEPDTRGLDGLLRPFEGMQQRHLGASTSSTPRHKVRGRRGRASSRLPGGLACTSPSLVVLYAEIGRAGAGGRPLCTLAAERPATGERLGVAVDGAASGLASYFRLDRGDLDVVRDTRELREAWRRFRRDGDVIVAWTHGTLATAARVLGDPLPPTPMKATYLGLGRAKGSLDEIVEAEGWLDELEREALRRDSSRTVERLAHASLMARFLAHPVAPGPAGDRGLALTSPPERPGARRGP